MSSPSDEQIEVEVAEVNSPSQETSLKEKFKKETILKNLKDFLITPFLFALIFLFLYGICSRCILPPSNYFSLFILYLSSLYFGKLAELIRLPDLFGMIVAGFICRNLSILQIEDSLDKEWSSFLRSAALVVILIRAGMGLDPKALRRMSFGVIRLALCPCLVEMATATLMSKLLLGLPWTYALILGSVLAAVSPAVVVPCLLSLSTQGYGVDKGIPTLVIAASSIDDVFAITLFGIFLGFTFQTGNLLYVALKSPLELLMGVVYGGVVGVFLWFIPRFHHKNKAEIRLSFLLLAGFVGMFLSDRLEFGGVGPIGALVLGFAAMIRFTKQENRFPAAQASNKRLADMLELVWILLKPFLFALIGAEIALAKIKIKLVGLGIVVLIVGLLTRMLTTFLVIFGNNLLLKEKVFVTISWLPKATVQAAIGGIALDKARKMGLSEVEQAPAMTVVTMAVLSIILTAPLGAILITKLGPRLLNKTTHRMLSLPLELHSSNGVLPINQNDKLPSPKPNHVSPLHHELQEFNTPL